MATYNKRGYKTPKDKVENDTQVENITIDEKDSTTAGVFNSLDQTASKTEEFVAKNQKAIFGIVAVIALVTVGYVLFQKFVAEPKEDTAATEMFLAQQNFQKATDGTKSDSLYNLALKGSEGKFGFVDIASKYEGTDAGNLANYYAGMAYLNTKKYDEAISYLEKFKSDDMVLSALAKISQQMSPRVWQAIALASVPQPIPTRQAGLESALASVYAVVGIVRSPSWLIAPVCINPASFP